MDEGGREEGRDINILFIILAAVSCVDLLEFDEGVCVGRWW